ncbi:MAG: pyruvate, phosphate dikinase [Dehalococcoidia bacterium]
MTENDKTKWVYLFSEGSADMVNLLGGKGANLAEMTNMGVPVPPGFTITTEANLEYVKADRKLPEDAVEQIRTAMAEVERTIGRKFGDTDNPLLVSVRSGARKSMPGMMETVLNVGLCSATIPGMIKQSGEERFVYDAYRRLITMYSDVVMEKAADIEPEDEETAVRPQLEKLMEGLKKDKGYTLDTDLTADDLKWLCEQYKSRVKEVLGKEFPDDAWEQLWGAIGAVFQSWQGKRAVSYRRVERIPDDWGTAVNVQAMVFGNMGEDSATGVAFTRDPSTGDPNFYGEWLVNAQGEDVVAGIRSPYALNNYCKQPGRNDRLPSLEEAMPENYRKLVDIRDKLERHYRDMQDIEFTIEHGHLWMLQTRTGKRNGVAAIRMATDMLDEGLIDERTAVLRVYPKQLDELLHPMLDPEAEKTAYVLGEGVAAGPGGAVGRIVLNADRARQEAEKGEKVILVRIETSPEDVDGMHAAQGIVTARGGMTSHAALVARGWGKCCVVGCSDLNIDYRERTVTSADKTLKEGDWVSVNGFKGILYEGKLPVIDVDPASNQWYLKLMEIADRTRRLGVRVNADTPKDAATGIRFGCEGIGLCRTEHMFFEGDRIDAIREMIVTDDQEGRKKAVKKLLPYQKEDFVGIFREMGDRPVTIRTLDPPLHEFLPGTDSVLERMAQQLGMPVDDLKRRVESLREQNPMLGHRGCRLGIVYPEITEMQVEAILEAACELKKEGIDVKPEIMIPLVGHVNEFREQENTVRATAKKVFDKYGLEVDYKLGTMIELPRAAITADRIAESAEFFSFGTNDLTQTAFGLSRDDAGRFLPFYLEHRILPRDPFEAIDQDGVGFLMELGVERGRATRDDLKIGICGEHGGEPESVMFCHRIGLDYVSCSPYRVPIARLAAAHAALSTG